MEGLRVSVLLLLLLVVGLVQMRWGDGLEEWNDVRRWGDASVSVGRKPLLVPLTLIQSATAQGAVCLDGTLPGYHLHRGYGSGSNRWLVQLEGGGWCDDINSCVSRKKIAWGSSKHMEKLTQFSGLLSNKPEENPDFFNWNRVKVRYCDGASFSGEGYTECCFQRSEIHASRYNVGGLFFRGQRIWLAVMKDLMSKGMDNASQALLSGSSAGGLASIIHCDEFRELFHGSTKVKCLADAGLFLDVVDVRGERTLRSLYEGVVTLQGVTKNLPVACTARMDATSCFFPQNLVASVKTPLFLLNAAYDVWQIWESLASERADPLGYWAACKVNYVNCNSSQLQFLQGFRCQMLNSLKVFSMSSVNGYFINSCFAHDQIERQDTWFANDSPILGNKTIAESVGDWYFDRSEVKAIDCPYPCDNTCHHFVLDQKHHSFTFKLATV